MKKLLAYLFLLACLGCAVVPVVGVFGLRQTVLILGGSSLFATALIWSLLQLSR